MGNTYPNHKGNYYYRNHTLCHIGTLDPLGRFPGLKGFRVQGLRFRVYGLEFGVEGLGF